MCLLIGSIALLGIFLLLLAGTHIRAKRGSLDAQPFAYVDGATRVCIFNFDLI